jgi:hypothetical protein
MLEEAAPNGHRALDRGRDRLKRGQDGVTGVPDLATGVTEAGPHDLVVRADGCDGNVVTSLVADVGGTFDVCKHDCP